MKIGSVEASLVPSLGEIKCTYGGLLDLFIVSLKNSHLFKIVELVISFLLKKIYNSVILNMWESFSGMVDHVTCPPWRPYNFSKFAMVKKKKKGLYECN